jgi:hypothetical protein
MTTIRFMSFPRTRPTPAFIRPVVRVFEQHEKSIATHDLKKGLTSDSVLAVVRDDLVLLGFRLELGKEKEKRIVRPVLFGMNGEPEKT